MNVMTVFVCACAAACGIHEIGFPRNIMAMKQGVHSQLGCFQLRGRFSAGRNSKRNLGNQQQQPTELIARENDEYVARSNNIESTVGSQQRHTSLEVACTASTRLAASSNSSSSSSDSI
jgi:hypothetical protein